MSSRGFYIAAAVFLAAFFAYYVFDLHRPAPASNGTPQAAPVISLDANTVSQIQIKAGGKTLTVVREGSEWRYSVCADAAAASCPTSVADTTRAVTLLQTILQLRPVKTIFGAPDGLPAYGLDKATIGEVDLQTPIGRNISLLVGATAPDHTNIYVRLSTSNDIQAVPAATVQTEIIGAIQGPPAPLPSPSAGASAVPSPSPS